MKYVYLKRKMFLDNLSWFDRDKVGGRFQMPYINKVLFCPNLLPFPGSDEIITLFSRNSFLH